MSMTWRSASGAGPQVATKGTGLYKYSIGWCPFKPALLFSFGF